MNILYWLALFTGFFPYLTIVSFGTDIQPWNFLSIFFIVTIFVLYSKRFDNNIKYSFIVFILSIILVFLSMSDLKSYIRSFIGYFSIVFSPFVYFYIISKNYNRFLYFLKLSTYIWFIVAVVQKFLFSSFGSILLNRISSDAIRGVTSLSPEPTFYGIVGIFYILVFYSIGYDKFKKYIFIWLFQILFLAQSSMAIVFLIIFYVYKIIFSFRLTYLLSLSIFFVLGLIIFLSIDINSYVHIRAVSLLIDFLDKGFMIFQLDQSLNDRLSAVFFSLKGFIDNYGLPHGMSSYSIYLMEELPKQDFFYGVSMDNRIMSYYGTILFELGIFGLTIPIVYSIIIYKAYKKSLKIVIHYLFFLHTILFAAIQLPFPFVGIYMGILLYKAKYENTNNTQ